MTDFFNNESVQITLFLGFALVVGWLRRGRDTDDEHPGAESKADGFVERRHRTNERLRLLTLAMYRDRHNPYPVTTSLRMRRHDDYLPSSDAAPVAPARSAATAATIVSEYGSPVASVRARRRVQKVKASSPRASKCANPQV